MVCRKRSIDEADERSSDVGFDVFVIRRVEPYNVSSSHAFLLWWSLWWRLEFQLVRVSLFLNASWYGGAASLKTARSDEMLDSRRLIAAGMFVMILGGWFDWL